MPVLSRERFVFCTDIDNTLFDYPRQLEGWLQKRGHRFVPDAPYRPEKQSNYLLRRFPELERDQLEEEILQFNLSPDFEDIPLMPGLIEGWGRLKRAYPNSLFIGLSSMGQHPDTVLMRRRQLSILDLDDFIALEVRGEKAPLVQQLGGTLLFEDHGSQIAAANALGIPTIVVDWPFNQNVTATARLTDWRQAPEIVEEVLRRSHTEAA